MKREQNERQALVCRLPHNVMLNLSHTYNRNRGPYFEFLIGVDAHYRFGEI